MSNYKVQFMDEAQVAEIDELMKDHGSALWAFGIECGNAAVAGFKRGRAERNMLIAGAVAVGAGAVYFGKKIVQKCKEKEYQKEFEVNVEM